ncbi:uncharacterized protein METZ01_LOCUS167607, partial [marine metagenome]
VAEGNEDEPEIADTQIGAAKAIKDIRRNPYPASQDQTGFCLLW